MPLEPYEDQKEFCIECGAEKLGTSDELMCPDCKNKMLEQAYWDRLIDEARGK